MINQLQIAQLQLIGQDGMDLLHRISTVNIPAFMKSSSLKEGLLLNPQGKIEAHFWIKSEPGQKDRAWLLFVKDPEGKQEQKLRAVLDQYTFAEKYTLGEAQVSNLEDIQNILDTFNTQHMRLIPGLEFECNGELTPYETNLLSAIDDQKGCYPGQEVIEKVISYGSFPKKLCLLKRTQAQPSSPLKPSSNHDASLASLRDSNGLEVGKIYRIDGDFALAIIRKTHLKEGQTLIDSKHHEYQVEKVS